MEVADIILDDSDNIYLAGRFLSQGGVVRLPPIPSDPITTPVWTYDFDGESASGFSVARALDFDTEGSCLYVTGEGDDPNEAGSARQVVVASLAPGTGTATYTTYLHANEIDPAAVSSAGFALTAETDTYDFATPVPYLYVLGRVTNASGESKVILARYHTGSCSLLSTTVVHDSNPASWFVHGGRSLLVVFPAPVSEAFRVSVFDATGRRVAERRTVRGETSLRFDGLSSGAYFVKGDRAGSAAVGRAVVVR